MLHFLKLESVSALHMIFTNLDFTEFCYENSFHASSYRCVRSSEEEDGKNAALKQFVRPILCHIYVVSFLFINNLNK
jgi:hypothetical protein